tara:strand:+ start:82 stop:696 length:615 start_codon:yes stop_codon:yes gene_type:complete
VIKKLLNSTVDFIWHKESNVEHYDCLIVPGGFSYGDYLRAGAIARFSPIMKSVVDFADKGGLVLGICNGFQVLVESGLLPGALITNKKVKFLSRDVTLKVESVQSPFTKELKLNDHLTMPMAHKQGNYQTSEDGLKKLHDNDQIAFTYVQHDKGSPNGSIANIAGIFNKEKNVLGMMPHPERAADPVLSSQDGLKIFNSLLGAA